MRTIACVGAVLVLACGAFAAPHPYRAEDPCAVARAELTRYWRAITGCEPPADCRFTVDPSLSDAQHDAYRIRATDRGGVAFVGSNGRSVIYAVYDFLERRGGCRWFWDGDIVPKKDAIDCAGLDVFERSQFEYRAIRYFAHRGLHRFQAEHWNLDDWKRELDWCLKRRLNCFMPRIGQDDLFQRAFPDIVPYPDPSKPLPSQGEGYDNRSLFWSLQFRGELRRQVLAYAFARGMIVPEDFGTMSHWYSRTPQEFLDKMKPPFIPQASKSYGQPSGLVWDIRDDKWLDAYWKLTEASIAAYGKPDVLHTIGLGERLCYTNRADNFAFKRYVLDRLVQKASTVYPDSKILFAGWDLYHSWKSDEVRALIPHLDKSKLIIWDYEADAYSPRRGNFTEWNVIGNFPYTFGIFLTLEQGLDVRANYKLIEQREKYILNDPYCVGYIFWPESSHTDTLLIEYFARNSWKAGTETRASLLPKFCRDRYGSQATVFEGLWNKTVDISTVNPDVWSVNYAGRCRELTRRDSSKNVACGGWCGDPAKTFAHAPALFAELADVPWEGAIVRRDTIDLARTAADRVTMLAMHRAFRTYEQWRKGKGDAAVVKARCQDLAEMTRLMADLLALHGDYSMNETYEALDRTSKITNPDFQHVLVDNAMCSYCASHQAELARFVWHPIVADWCAAAQANLDKGTRDYVKDFCREDYLARALKLPLAEMRPALARTPENYRATLRALARVATRVIAP